MSKRAPVAILRANPGEHPQALSDRLARVLLEGRGRAEEVAVMGRAPVPSPGRTPAEVLTCRFADGSVRRLLCKYGHPESAVGYGHWGGVPYEAAVYQQVLRVLRLSPVELFGAYEEAETGATWLFLEYLDGSSRLDDTGGVTAFAHAAAWIGRFHTSAQQQLATGGWQVLADYDEAYYRGWITRTAVFAEPLREHFPWLKLLCQRWERVVAPLLAARTTVIHGEYYPKNILVHDGGVYPIDWESAAIGAGEIDLASLTERWPPDIVHQCQLEYQRVRWPEGPPPEFERTLAAARLYLQFRWMGDRVKWTTRPKNHWRFGEMQRLAERLELI